MKFRIKNIVRNTIGILLIFAVMLSCKPTKHVPQHKFLLKNVKIECDNKDIDINELENYIKQKPNTRILNMFRFHLFIYNLSNSGKDRKWKNKFKNVIGEEPVIYEEYQTKKTLKQFKLYLKNRAYYNSTIDDTTIFKRKQATILYRISANEPFKINKIEYKIQDTAIKKILLADTLNSLLKKGILFDTEILQEERSRISNVLKNNGYYYFSKKFVDFLADSLSNSKQINLVVNIHENQQINSENQIVFSKHKKYKIKDVCFYTDYDQTKALNQKEEYFKNFDTISIEGVNFAYQNSLKITPDVIFNANYLVPDQFFSLINVSETNKRLAALQVFKIINIQFIPLEDITENYLNCKIYLSPTVSQSYTVEGELTSSSGYIGFGGNLMYKHNNLFKGAEIFNLKLLGSAESQSTVEDNPQNEKGFIPNTIEYGFETKLFLPKFLIPFNNLKNYRKFKPKTSLSLAYHYQNRPDYTRTIRNASFGYYWKGDSYTENLINPIEINSIKLSDATEEFLDYLDTLYIKSSYETQFISSTNYSYIFNNQNVKKSTDFNFFRLNTEVAGNLLTLSNLILNTKKDEDYYQVLNSRYAQYFKFDIDFRHYNYINPKNIIIYRGFFGIGIPYGNSESIPFVKKYFSGGANSVRGWRVRSLGPGSYIDSSNVPNLSADIKLEANLELRFDMFWIIKGAIFLDFGNIWALSEKTDNRIGASFEFDRFYKEIAVGTGIGLRFDFGFFVFRSDLGIKVRDPMEIENKWIIGNREYSSQDFMLNVGVGYPF
ncbi:MAG: BamA/TamA family outer membrane protein [Bacteroidetes bacterium]|nr:BamA/TamA family outer membrane protein [Bacteroidota bacterium]MBT6685734.1 BamA/TamA family outer membrane protein [Bacteroidota bacterium]MBT7143030.1 BamA/TamA family outer membrane protein [Bacteroidota bacterium]MBT7493443.1 BamA/TamA family outer membrane protein [Bacteroidota bacterium]